jgi:hypothetical protein
MITKDLIDLLAKGDDVAVAERIDAMHPFQKTDALIAISMGSSAARGVIDRLARGEIDLEKAHEELSKLGPVAVAAARNIVAKGAL